MNWILFATVFVLALGAFLLVMIGLAIGVIMGRKRLTGSCGGIANTLTDSETDNETRRCELCTKPDRICSQKP